MLNTEEISKEIHYRTSRSSGSGGQHVNKVETRVEAVFNLFESISLSEAQKCTLKAKLGKRLTSAGDLIVSSSESRSQHRNKQLATQKLLSLLEMGLKKIPKRKPTSIPAAAKAKRLQDKRFHAEKKLRRGFKS